MYRLINYTDARCPPIHYPPSLRDYLRTGIKPRKKVLLVLTKTDLVGPIVANKWKEWLEEQEASEVTEVRFRARVVLIQSYEAQSRSILEQGTKIKYKPSQPLEQRVALIDAIQILYDEICAPPPSFADNPDKLASWRPRVPPGIDLQSLKSPTAPLPKPELPPPTVQIGKAEAKKARKIERKEHLQQQQILSSTPSSQHDSEASEEEEVEPTHQEGYNGHRVPPYLTIGTVGKLPLLS